MSETFDDWIGRTDGPVEDQISPRLCDQFRATFGDSLADTNGVPLGIHWCLAQPTIGSEGLGQDGHPAKGGFLPPVELPRRMWAGGSIEFLAPFEMGDTIRKSSTIKNIVRKSGTSGSLVFVTVSHEYSTPRGVGVREDQTIVYREAACGPAVVPTQKRLPTFDKTQQFKVNSTSLFRYSAMTFNGHRIHYDMDYARSVEHYLDLVIHGPLQATLLMNFATQLKSRTPSIFSYRGLAPATGEQTLLMGAVFPDAESLELAIVDARGTTTMKATAKW